MSEYRRFKNGAIDEMSLTLHRFLEFTRRRRIRTIARIAFAEVAMLLMAFMVCATYQHAYDTDGWFLLDTGRTIVEDGFPQTNPWAIAQGLGVVVQQWLHDVLLYGAYSVGGFDAVSLFGPASLAVVGLLALANFEASCSDLGRKVPVAGALVVLAYSSYGLYGWETVRPSIWSLAFALVVFLLCGRYRATGERRWLCLLPLVTFLHAQVHISHVWLDVAIVAGHCLPSTWLELKGLLVRSDWAKLVSGAEAGLVLRGVAPSWAGVVDAGSSALSTRRDRWRAFVRDRRWYLAAAFGMMVASLLNPYGVRGALYLFESFGAASFGGMIIEMQPLWTGSGRTLQDWVALALVCSLIVPAICSISRRCVRLDLTLMALLACVASVAQLRNGWMCYLMGYVLWANAFAHKTCDLADERGVEQAQALALASREEAAREVGERKRLALGRSREAEGLDADLAGLDLFQRWLVNHAAVALLVCSVMLGGVITYYAMPSYWANGTPSDSFESNYDQIGPLLEQAIEQTADGAEPVIYTDMGAFNFLEWEGVPVIMDARPELWEPAISGRDEHLWREYVTSWMSLRDGSKAFSDYLRKNGVRWVLLSSDFDESLKKYEGIEQVGQTDTYRLWKVDVEGVGPVDDGSDTGAGALREDLAGGSGVGL